MRILIFGATGQVGAELKRLWSSAEVASLGHADCDLRDPDAVRSAIRQIDPRIILNAAAYTAVDRAESEADDCFEINSMAPGVMAEEAERSGALLVHYSTDYVFDGQKDTPYAESDAADPQNVYGRSKLEGERAIEASRAKYLIFRTSWVFSPHGKNFMNTMLRLAQERDSLRVVDDQIGSPTSAIAIARATARILQEMSADEAVSSGLYHMTAAGHVSWCNFARAIFERAAIERAPSVLPIRTEEYPTPARRPKNSRLSNDRFAATFGFRLSSWQEQLAEALATLSILRPSSPKKGATS